MTSLASPSFRVLATVCAAALLLPVLGAPCGAEEPPDPGAVHRETVDDPYLPVPPEARVTSPPARVVRNGFVSVQVNVDADGMNVVGDAANEPSIAVDPDDRSRMAIGWRQFDTVASDFRQAGWASTTDGGASWSGGVLTPGTFRSDPVLGTDGAGNFFYYSLEGDFTTDTFRSTDGGASWGPPVFSFGGDKAWMGIDRSGGTGDGHVYDAWSTIGCCGDAQFNRSIDGGDSFQAPFPLPQMPVWGVVDVGPQGTVYLAGRRAFDASQFAFLSSTTLQDPMAPQGFDFVTLVNLGGAMIVATGPNPGGLLGQVWVAADRSTGPLAGNVYILCSVDPPGPDPLDVHFVRTTDGGMSWTAPARINDDPADSGAWQWFGTLSAAPDGRLDAVWNDTRADPGGFVSVLTYAFSEDGGVTWSPNVALTPPFDPHLGWPQQNKIGDYYHMVSDVDGADLAYAATFNGEQDVYYLRIDPGAFVFVDGFESGDTGAWSATVP